MSTKTVSTQEQTQNDTQRQDTTFDPQSLSAYRAFMPQYQGVLGDYMQNPLTASYFNQQVGMANRQIGQAGQSGITQLMQNLRAAGGGVRGPALQSMLMQQQRGQSAQRSNAFMQLLMGAQQNRQWATGQAMGFNPLVMGMTGSSSSKMTGTSTTKKSGLGTWLPQLLGAGLGAVTGGFGGGGDKGGGGGGFGGGGLTSPFGGSGNYNPANPLGYQAPNPWLRSR